MGEAVARLEALVALSKVYVPPHVRVIDGKPVKVEGYWRTGGKGSAPDLGASHIPAPSREVPLDVQRIPARPSDAIDVKDFRKNQSTPITVDPDRMDAALAAAGVKTGPGLEIRLRIKDQKGGQQGSMRQIGPNAFRVIIRVAHKPEFADRHRYVLNNSLVHELRHVAQAQADPNFQAKYVAATKKFGYTSNPYEVEARYYGRLADHTGKKHTGPAGTAVGKDVWGLDA